MSERKDNPDDLANILKKVVASGNFMTEFNPDLAQETIAICPRVGQVLLENIRPGSKVVACANCQANIWASPKSQRCARQYCMECVEIMLDEEVKDGEHNRV